MLTHPVRMAGRERLRFALDAGAIMSAAAIFIWYFSIGPNVGADRTQLGAEVLTPALMLVSTFALVKLMLGGNPPFTRKAGVVGGLATALSGLATGFAPLLTDTTYSHLGFAVRLLPCILITATPRVQEVQFRADPDVLNRPRRPYTLLPYTAVGAVQALLILALSTGDLTVRAWGVVAGVVLITGLVVVRQLVAFSDNVRLVGKLDESLLLVRRQEERFRSLVQNASDITAVVRTDGAITYASPAIERILGVTPDDVTGHRVAAFVHPTDRTMFRMLLTELQASPDVGLPCELRVRHANGSWRWLGVTATNRIDDPSVGGIVCNARDVTESLESRDQLRHQATHDPLTGLANRLLFDERIRSASRRSDSQAAILLIDLDDFKEVNDTLGHHAGDVLLITVAQRLLTCARTTDTVARLGGDEFALFLPDADAGSGTNVAQRILDAFRAPIVCDGETLTIKASIGVAAGPVTDPDALLRAADATMYEAKRHAKGTVATAGAPG
jgi:diguanylate cyclase (GGDEF)-like protein/PAS domain S-box-containing protein